jgi:PadR family transcriptional regulator, regulatory protein PadR
MKRKRDVLIPIEISILTAGLSLQRHGQPEFHGFAIAKEMRDEDGARRLTAQGTLYKALDRLERSGLLRRRWEDPEIAAEEGRPRRRLYSVTVNGERALAEARRSPLPNPSTRALEGT